MTHAEQLSGLHPARLWKPLSHGLAQCRLCSHFCRIEPGQRGLCGVRQNRDGELFSLVYGLPAALGADPVEKKPLYHFLPGTRTFSLGTMGCNLFCSFCQNASLAQPPGQGQAVRGHQLGPQALVDAACDSGCRSMAYTYSEPTVFFELVEDASRLAVRRGLKNILVSNGFMSPDCLKAFGPAQGGCIQAANVDIKAFTETFYAEQCGARLAPVLENVRHMRELGWWLEITTLVIPGLNDAPGELEALAAFIVRELGPDTPWHLSRFHPAHRLQDRPVTPTQTLLDARAAGRAAGLKYIYLGNASGLGFGDTLCPACGKTAIEREGFLVIAGEEGALPGGVCPWCGAALPGTWA